MDDFDDDATGLGKGMCKGHATSMISSKPSQLVNQVKKTKVLSEDLSFA